MPSENDQKVVEKYEEIVTSLTDPVIIKTALKLSYYVVMLDAALADPMGNPDDHNEAIDLFYKNINETVDTFKQLVNEKL